ncbi:carboxypeptidase regulatory-like domain-containing protein [Duganella sp. FT3S]|uniref:Carboxypeptidase regulatory-like domain-containing protein n=1 Tax=Rugamonas fusca TaxID=2758568 RepID=A0A7W2I551_9BURK|nr:carboxypeptidase regulatory-like domain-containing protein [Rugamonas fusca]MBA5603963.1 carboxypeptidase regulatory-like domain-containing protein [Rugamonas fusca]
MRVKFRTLMLSLLVALPATVGVAPAMAADAQQVPFLNGGVGEDQQQEMLAARKDYNLLLTFATRGSGEYVSDVHLTVTDHEGKAVLQLNGAGPLVYARVAPGNYKVEAVARGVTQTQAATVAKQGARDLYFYWAPDAPAGQ